MPGILGNYLEGLGVNLIGSHWNNDIANPNYTDPSQLVDAAGTQLDKHGNPISDEDAAKLGANLPARTPSLAEKMFSPATADKENAINSAYSMADANRAVNYGDKMYDVTKAFSSESPEMQTSEGGSPQARFARYGTGAVTPGMANEGAVDTGFAANGGITNTIGGRINRSLQEGQESGNAYRKAVTDSLLNLPEKTSVFNDQSLGFDAEKLGYDKALLPRQYNLGSTTLSNEQTLANQLGQRLPSLGRSASNMADIDAATSSRMKSLLPNTLDTMSNDSTRQNLESHWAPVMSPYGEHITGNTAELAKNPMGMNPSIANYLGMLSMGQQGLGGAGGAAADVPGTLPSGLKGTATPMFTAPVGQSNSAGSAGAGAAAPSSQSQSPDSENKIKRVDDALIQQAKQIHDTKGVNSPEYKAITDKIQALHDQLNPPTSLDRRGLVGLSLDKLAAINHQLSSPRTDAGADTSHDAQAWRNFYTHPLAARGPLNVSPEDIKKALGATLFGY